MGFKKYNNNKISHRMWVRRLQRSDITEERKNKKMNTNILPHVEIKLKTSFEHREAARYKKIRFIAT